MNENYDVIAFILSRPKKTNFADIIKIATMFIKKAFKI